MMTRLPMLVTVFLLLAGCATYGYNNEKFYTASAALSAQGKRLERIANGISAEPTSISGTAVVITPSKDTFAASSFVIKNNSPPLEQVDWLAGVLANEFAAFATYLERSRAFTGVERRVVDQPLLEARQVSANYVATIYLEVLSPSQTGWHLLTPGAKEPRQINLDARAAEGVPKVTSWVRSIVQIMSTRLSP